MTIRIAKFQIGDIVRHRVFPFRGVVFDVDVEFANTEEWWRSIPEDVRPRKDQPYYHLLAENDEVSYIAYVSEQNLLMDESGEAVSHPGVGFFFTNREGGRYFARASFTKRTQVSPPCGCRPRRRFVRHGEARIQRCGCRRLWLSAQPRDVPAPMR